MVEMRIVVPPGQRLPEVSARVSISRAEVVELRDALDEVLASGSSGWNVGVKWADVDAFVSVALEVDLPRNGLDPAGQR